VKLDPTGDNDPKPKKPAKKRARKAAASRGAKGKGEGKKAGAEPGSSKKGTPGRPTDYNEDVAERLCLLVAEGLSIRKICAVDGMPAVSTFCQWLSKHDEFAEQYARAKEVAAEMLADEIVEIADNVGNEHRDTIEFEKGGVAIQIPDKEWILRSKLRVEARLKLMELLYPKKYGPRLNQKISGKLETKNSHTVSPELEAAILERTAEAAKIAATVVPPASFRGEESDE
jgi:hypothetical protein